MIETRAGLQELLSIHVYSLEPGPLEVRDFVVSGGLC
jgi:hypothetical protein